MNIRYKIIFGVLAATLTACQTIPNTPPKETLAMDQQNLLWLEEVQGKAALEWVEQQNRQSTSALESNPQFQTSYNETLQALDSDHRIPYPIQRGQYLYNFWQDAQHPRGIYRQTTLASYQNESPEWETVLDFDALSAKEGKSWVYQGMNGLHSQPNRCLIKLSPGGSDAVVVREFDLESKQFVDDGFSLPEAKSRINWRDIDHAYVATDFGPDSLTDSGYPRLVKLWKRGTPLNEAITLHQAATDSISASAYRMHSPQGAIDLIQESTSFYTSKTWALEDGQKIQLQIPDDVQVHAYLQGQLFLSLTSDWQVGEQIFQQGSVVYADYAQLVKGQLQVKSLIEPTSSISITAIRSSKSALLISLLDNVRSKVLRFTAGHDGNWKSETLNLDDNGSLSVFGTETSSDDFFINYSSFLDPGSLYRFDGVSGQIQQLKQQPGEFDASNLVTRQQWAISKDGTRVPYFIVMDKALKYDGNNPTLLYGYGGFEVSLDPYYSAVIGKNWLSKGGVYVLANIRGGGEFGPAWHQAALKTNRHKAFEDFEAIVEDLIQRKITSARHLGIQGGSNGGLLVGAAFTRRPELYNAVVCQVPLLDMQRYTKLLAGASWAAEYGDPDEPEMWDYIKSYSPLHNLDPQQSYPKVFFTTSTKDDRVHPAHARKMVARMQALGKPVYYFENTEGGHAGAADNKQRAYVSALIYSYLWQQLGSSAE